MTDDDGFRDLFVELLDVYDLTRGARLKPTHQPVGHIAHGWYTRCRRSLEGAVLLGEQGFGEEASPIMRCGLEHAVALAWLGDKGAEAAQTIQRGHAETAGRQADALRGANWPIPDWSLIEEVIADNPGPTSQDHLWAFRHLFDTYGRPAFYAAWLLETARSHPGYQSAVPYMRAMDGYTVTALLDQAEDDGRSLAARGTVWLLSATASMDLMFEGGPMRSALEAFHARAVLVLNEASQ